jgi:anti-sigma factor RsiW
MQCPGAAQLEAYYDGELSPAMRVQLESHLLHCDACRAALEQSRNLSAMIAAAPLAPMPDTIMSRLRDAFDLIRARSLGERMIQERAARERGVRRVAGWLTAAAAALLLGGLVMMPSARKTTEVVDTFDTADAAAVMPPHEQYEGTPEVIQVAQWIAEDLSVSTDAPRPNR